MAQYDQNSPHAIYLLQISKRALMQPVSKADAKNALREKNRISAKEFIKMKRGQAKEEKNNSESFERIRTYISEGSQQPLEQFIFNNKADFILTFLFSQNELKQTPLMQIIKSDACYFFLKIINKWSLLNSDFIIRQIYMEDNKLKSNDFRGRFQNLNKNIMEVISNRITSGKDYAQLIQLLGEKDSIFYHLCKIFLTLEMIISTVTSLKTKHDILTHYYVKLLTYSALNELQELALSVNGYQSILMREKLWSQVDASIVKEVNKDNFDLLTLRELKYNIWHQLANKSSTQFLQTCNLIVALDDQHDDLREQYWQMMLQIDSSGESVTDKYLSKWKFKQILALFNVAKRIDNIILSTNCLNILFDNRHLNQLEREELVTECLQGQMSTKGYVKIIAKSRQKKWQRKGEIQNNKIILELKPLKFAYSICYDKSELKKQRDNADGFALINYLNTYKQNAKLRTVQQLYLQFLNKKEIKKKLGLLLKVSEETKVKIDKNSAKRDQIQGLFDYYQPIWKLMTFLPHGEVLQYLLSKIHINCYEIKLMRSNDAVYAEFGGKHFMAYYIQNNPFLGQDDINKQIIESIIKCKPSQKIIGRYNLELQLARSLNDKEILHKSHDYLVVTLRSHLKSHLLSLPFEQYMQYMQVGRAEVLLDVIAKPLSNKKMSLLSQQEIISICDPQILKQDYERNYKQCYKTQIPLKKLYKHILTQLNVQIDEDEEEVPLIYGTATKNFLQLQKLYQSLPPQKKHTQFFDKLKDWLDSITGIQHAKSQSSLKFYCFRLLPTQSHLVYKFKRLLEHGIDPYFPKYSKDNIEFKQQDKEWNEIMAKMVKNKKTFTGALITSPSTAYNYFKNIFEACLSGQKFKQDWIRWSLFRTIQQDYQYYKFYGFYTKYHLKGDIQNCQIEFIKAGPYEYNFETIVNILQLCLQHGLLKNEFVLTLLYYFNIAIRQLSIELKSLSSEHLYAKQEQKEQIKSKFESCKNKAQQFIDRWLPFVKQNSLTQDFIIQSFLINLLQNAFYQKNDFLGQCIIKHVQFERVTDTNLVIEKLKYSKQAEQILYVYLMSQTDHNLISWFQRRIHPQTNKFTEIIKSFSFENQKNIINHLIERIIKNETAIQNGPKSDIFDNKNFLRWSQLFFKSILAAIDQTNIPQFLKILQESLVSTKAKETYKTFLLRSTDDIQIRTLAFIVLNPANKYEFYIKEGEKIKKFHTNSFYFRCNQNNFDTYLKNLEKYHHLSTNIALHLKIVIICLIESESWQRLEQLMKIKSLLSHIVPLTLKALHHTLSKQIRQENPLVKKIINTLFTNLQAEKTQFQEDLFIAAFSFDQSRAFLIFKPQKISIYGYRRCLSNHPESSHLFIENKIILNRDFLPDDIVQENNGEQIVYGKRLKYWFPMIPHSVDKISTDKWLIDELRVELSLLNGLNSTKYLRSTLIALCTTQSVLAHKKQIYQNIKDDISICRALLRCNQLKSLSSYEKYIPNLQNIVKQELLRQRLSKKGQCMNLNILNPTLLKQLIVNRSLSSSAIQRMYSCFLRIVDTANMYLIELFITTNKIQIKYDYLQIIHEIFEFRFWDHLLGINNQEFIIAFITKYKLFQLYPTEEYSEKLLNTICRLRWNKLFEFTFKYFEAKSGNKAVFVAETIQNKPSISQKGVFYLPIQTSIQNNFYQVYFLIQGCHNQCPKFKLSGRFLSYVNPEEWNYLPEMKRRVLINNTFMQSLRQAQEMQFRFKVLLPSIFELQTANEAKPEEEEPQKKKSKGYSESLCKFIHDITKKSLHLSQSSGNFEKLCFMIFKQKETKIPEAQLQKRYPSQMKIINKIRTLLDNIDVDISLNQLFYHVPEFKSQLLIHNPTAFLKNPQYLYEIMGEGPKKLDFSEYLKGIQINFLEFKQKYNDVLEKYIIDYFFQSSVPLGSPQASHHLTRQALLLIFLDISQHERKWNDCSIFNVCRQRLPFEYDESMQQTQAPPEDQRIPEEVLYDISKCLNVRVKNTMAFDLMVWNKIIKGIQQIEGFWKQLSKGSLKEYKCSTEERNKIIQNYAKIVTQNVKKYNISNIKDVLCQVYEQHIKTCNKKGAFIELSLLLNVSLLLNDLKMLEQKINRIKGGHNVQKIKVTLVSTLTTKSIIFEQQSQISIQVPFTILSHESKQISLLMIDYNDLIQHIEHKLYISNLQAQSQLYQLNDFCSKIERQSFLRNYKFRYTVQSFKSIKYESLTNILQHGHMKNDGAVGKILNELQKMEERLIGTKNIKVYSPSDIYGPINFSQEKDDEKMVDCLGFYELIQLPKVKDIKVTYNEKIYSTSEKNHLILKQVRNYIKYYKAASRDQNIPEQLQMEHEIFVSVRKHRNEERVELEWWRFGAWIVCQIYCLALGYCSDMSSKIDKILDVRVSFLSLINYYEKYLEYGYDLSIRQALQKLLFQKQFNKLVESIIIMITEDVGNIMKIVKGIIIKWTINNKNSKKRAKLVISQFASAVSVQYEVKDQLLSININLEMAKDLNKGHDGKQSDDCHLLVDRKEFLDCVFTSAQFLTDYFVMRGQLNNECLKISTSITNKLNTTVHFHIQYSNLYAYIDKMREERSIKDIESFLVRLKQYLHNSMDKVINLYLNSQEIANKHQVFILNKCESINKNIPFKTIELEKELIYDSLEKESQNGLTEVITLMNQIGNDQNIKNVFLIQIYKSYYTTMVGEGMTFVVGYKSSKKKSQVIKITKAENINLINIVELDFIMLVSKNIPTNDELNQSKIIRIFITDSNKNLYQLNDKIKQQFLNLPEENQQRNIAYFAPLIPSNVMLNFSLNQKREPDTKDTKVFFIDLNESAKFKLTPNFDKPLSPLNSCKKNLEFKQAISQLQKEFSNFYKQSVKFIIDLPEQFTQKYVNVNFSHIIHLVSSDLLQFLIKFEFEPMRNDALDCQLSIFNEFTLNKNSIIQLRKRSFMKHYSKLRIKVRDNSSGITFAENEIIICIDVTNMTSLPSSTEYLSMIVDNILKQEKKAIHQNVTFAETDKNESTQVILKQLDLINCITYQTQEIQQAIQLINLLFNKKFKNFRIYIHRKKTEIKFDEEIQMHLNIQTVEREFFSSEQIIRSFVAFANKNFEANTKAQTFYNPIQENIVVQQCSSKNFKIIYRNLQSKWIIQNVTDMMQAYKRIKGKCLIPSRYYITQSNNIYSNFFFDVDKKMAIAQRNEEGIRCKSKHLYLQSSKPIHLNFTNIFITETSPLFKQNTNNFNILRSPLEKNKITIQLLSKNMYLIIINYEQSMILNINFAGNINIFNPQVQNTKLVISSDGELCLDNTKFIELQAYKKKPVLIKQKQNENKNSQFRQSNERASEDELELKLGDMNNIENLVYVVNDQCKKFLTRAGELRVDYIQLCDPDNNPIDYKNKLDVFFVHINRLSIVRPQIITRNMQLGLSWTPTIRGHYYLYINNVRMNPPYEIGVCAGQADYKTSIVTTPKIQKICYCEQSQLMLDLRDCFGNLYTQLEEDILGDSLLIELRCSKMIQFFKLEKSQINKYGLKKLKFSFNNIEQQKIADIQISVYLNCEFVSKFTLIMEGLSLKQRKKLLQKDINLNSKNYYKDISINRNRFLEDLFVIAEKSLHTNLSVRFVNEPGIDAGGVKREFYDMIGNQIKSERNPFFKLINPNTMEYFLNPQILRNKKKLEYMQLWGKYLANSFLNSYLIGVSFSPVFVKLLYEQSIDYEDLLSVLPAEQKKQYEYLLTASPQDFEDLDLYFTVMIDKKKCLQVQLKQGGKDIQVTAQNVKEYLQCTAQMLLTQRYKEIMISFRKGFETVIQLGIFKKWIRNNQFWCLTAGNKEITPQLVLNYIVFQGYGIDNISGWFRRFISEANHQVLIGFLKFSSGSSSIDFSLTSKVTVTFENAGDNPKKLPISHTCWKEIVVPKYKNYDILKKLLTAAFIYCSEGFGFG